MGAVKNETRKWRGRCRGVAAGGGDGKGEGREVGASIHALLLAFKSPVERTAYLRIGRSRRDIPFLLSLSDRAPFLERKTSEEPQKRSTARTNERASERSNGRTDKQQISRDDRQLGESARVRYALSNSGDSPSLLTFSFQDRSIQDRGTALSRDSKIARSEKREIRGDPDRSKQRHVTFPHPQLKGKKKKKDRKT